MKRVYIFPRYDGDINSDWYMDAKNAFSNKNNDTILEPTNLPNWNKPSVDEFLSFIGNEIDQNSIDKNTYFVGHSIGCKAALIFLDKLHKTNPQIIVGGLLCVAGWWTIDKPWPQLKKWINSPIEFDGIRQICNHNIVSILSDNDPYTANYQANKKEWEDKLNAKVLIIPNAKHFNNKEGFSEIMSELESFTTN